MLQRLLHHHRQAFNTTTYINQFNRLPDFTRVDNKPDISVIPPAIVVTHLLIFQCMPLLRHHNYNKPDEEVLGLISTGIKVGGDEATCWKR